jgi:predicted ester cyclase
MSAPTESSPPKFVEAFYQRIWNDGDLDAVRELLTDDFVFRGSLGAELRGIAAFTDYVRSVREALAGYRCDVLECVSEGERAFAKMRFGGRHVDMFRGYTPTGKPVQWLGAALFRFEGSAVAELWVLGDLVSLDAMLKANQAD